MREITISKKILLLPNIYNLQKLWFRITVLFSFHLGIFPPLKENIWIPLKFTRHALMITISIWNKHRWLHVTLNRTTSMSSWNIWIGDKNLEITANRDLQKLCKILSVFRLTAVLTRLVAVPCGKLYDSKAVGIPEIERWGFRNTQNNLCLEWLT
jgi:hypothetical protein